MPEMVMTVMCDSEGVSHLLEDVTPSRKRVWCCHSMRVVAKGCVRLLRSQAPTHITCTQCKSRCIEWNKFWNRQPVGRERDQSEATE